MCIVAEVACDEVEEAGLLAQGGRSSDTISILQPGALNANLNKPRSRRLQQQIKSVETLRQLQTVFTMICL